MSVYEDIFDALDAHQGDDGHFYRLMKLSEEVGEVMQAVIGCNGMNARKGFSHNADDVANELCDVVITAMVALHDWTDDPEVLLKHRIDTLKDRIAREGS